MHIISRKALQQFWKNHPESKNPLSRWYKVMQKNDFASFNELRDTFPTAYKVGDFFVFNISGNKFRLIVSIHFNRKRVYLCHVLTHSEYDKGAWKK
jgi:mRNA interferase HigB